MSKTSCTILAALLTCACGVDPVSIRSGAITGGQPHAGHPSVGSLLRYFDGQGWRGICTASLVGDRTVLTAAHCVAKGGSFAIAFDSGEQVEAQSVVSHPWYSKEVAADRYDFAVALLGSVPTTVTPHPLTAQQPWVGMPLTMVGYGNTMCTIDEYDEQHCSGDAGVKRLATNTVTEVTSAEIKYFGQGSTCAGDSGGPVFAVQQGLEVQVGVTARSARPCGSGTGFLGRPDVVVDWVRQLSGGDVLVDEAATSPPPPTPPTPPPPNTTDTTPPTVSFVSPAQDAVLAAGPIDVRLAVADDNLEGVDLLVDASDPDTRFAPPFDYAPVLTEPGEHVLQAIAWDSAGNTQMAMVIVELVADAAPPAPPAPTPPGEGGGEASPGPGGEAAPGPGVDGDPVQVIGTCAVGEGHPSPPWLWLGLLLCALAGRRIGRQGRRR